MNIAITMFKLILTMAVGFFLSKKEILTPDTNRKLSTMILDVTAPFLIFSSAGSLSDAGKGDILLMLWSGLLLYALLPLLGFLVSRLIRSPKGSRGIYACCLMFSNAAFMGYPIVQAFYGDSAIFYTTVFNFGYNLVFYSLALFLIDREAGRVSKFEPKRLLTPGMLVGFAAIIINLLNVPIPDQVYDTCGFIGSVTTPLSMLIIGANISQYSVKEIFSEKRVFIISFVRLLIIPILVVLFMKLWTQDPLLIAMCAMTMGMPVGSMLAMAGSKYEATSRLSNLCVVTSTLLSILTIPVLVVIFKFWLGV